MRAVVTGGAGFVGSNLTKALLEEGHHVAVVDDFFTGQANNVPEEVELIAGCVTDYQLMLRACRNADIVFHVACRNIIVSIENPEDDFRVNAGGTFNVLLAARDANVPRVIYTSSCSVYGNQSRVPTRETDPTSFLTPYAASKHAGEAYCQAFQASYGMTTSVVRFSNLYGPGQRPDNPYCGVVSRFLYDSIEGRPMRIYGAGEQTRDYTYIDDAVRATILVANASTESVYNVATEKETTVNELAELVGGPVEYVALRNIDTISRRTLSIDKITDEFPWRPRVTLEDGVELTREWLQQTYRPQKETSSRVS